MGSTARGTIQVPSATSTTNLVYNRQSPLVVGSAFPNLTVQITNVNVLHKKERTDCESKGYVQKGGKFRSLNNNFSSFSHGRIMPQAGRPLTALAPFSRFRPHRHIEKD